MGARTRAPSTPIALLGPAVLVLGAFVPALRPIAAVSIAAGWLVLRGWMRFEAIAWAAALPIAVGISWPWILGADVPLGAVGCTDPLSIIAVRRVIVAVVVLAIVGALVRVDPPLRRDLALTRPSRVELAIALGGLLVLAVGGLVVGPLVARPFFGPLEFATPLAALVPAVAFGVANGTLEEVAYRGALQGWLGRVVGPGAAILVQALVFGIAHAGVEVTGLLPVHIALMATVGILAGLVVRRTGSLAIPIGIHIGADIALYYGLACRATS